MNPELGSISRRIFLSRAASLTAAVGSALFLPELAQNAHANTLAVTSSLPEQSLRVSIPHSDKVTKVPPTTMKRYTELFHEFATHSTHAPAALELGLQSEIPKDVITAIIEQGRFNVQPQPYFQDGWSITYNAPIEGGPYSVKAFSGQRIEQTMSVDEFRRIIFHFGAIEANRLYNQVGFKFKGDSDEVGLDLKYDTAPRFYSDQKEPYPPLFQLTPKYVTRRAGFTSREEGTSGIQGYNPDQPTVLVLDYYGTTFVDNTELYNGPRSLLQFEVPDFCGSCA